MRKLYIFGGLIFGVILFVFKATFCNAASIALDPSAVSSFANGVNSFGSGAFNFSTMNPAMLPSLYDNINQNLYENFGYDIDMALWDAEDNFTKWATGQEENPLNGAPVLGVETANWVADKMFQAGATASALINGGYHYFSQVIPQWGQNAKQFFVGKIDEATGKISQVGQNVVTKITAEGLAVYASINQALQDNGSIYNLSESDLPMYGNTFDFFFIADHTSSNSPIMRIHMVLNYDCVLVNPNYSNSNNLVITDGPRFYYLKTGNDDLACVSCSVVDSYGHLVSNDPSLVYFNSNSYISINGVNVYHGNFAYGGYYAQSGSTIPPSYYFSTAFVNNETKKTELLSILNSGESYIPIGYSYNYASNALSLALKDQLERLLDKYVDSLTLQRINDIVGSISTTVQDGVIVANPTQEVVDELTGVIDDAIEDSTPYEEVFEAFYDEAIDTPADPDPDPTSIEPYIEIDPPVEPIDTVSEVLTIPFKLFTSIFEPIFLVFGGSLFGLWLFIPVIILFIILIWALK